MKPHPLILQSYFDLKNQGFQLISVEPNELQITQNGRAFFVSIYRNSLYINTFAPDYFVFNKTVNIANLATDIFGDIDYKSIKIPVSVIAKYKLMKVDQDKVRKLERFRRNRPCNLDETGTKLVPLLSNKGTRG